MNTKDALESIFIKLNKNDVVVVSNGMLSRDVFSSFDRDLNFYMLGSMGMALAIGIGIAYTRPDIKVNVITGDGAALMSLNTFVLANYLDLKNLYNYILDNNAYATTGGQKTCSDNVRFKDLAPRIEVIKIDNYKSKSARISLTPIQIKERFMNALHNIKQK